VPHRAPPAGRAVTIRTSDPGGSRLERPTEVVHVVDWRLNGLNLVLVRSLASGKDMAVPPGENGWLVHLERFLFAREEHVRDLLRAGAGR
jgi:hypothetical protein